MSPPRLLPLFSLVWEILSSFLLFTAAGPMVAAILWDKGPRDRGCADIKLAARVARQFHDVNRTATKLRGRRLSSL
ncbi:hypothetical protein PROFUN_14214 [Planoprotostelium fungivorum]|uniref:Uncharacterized protein n=1 Tax=Planoprotostelium fungivorum TaxID=1890364 RepID=A0A2P6N0N7_9EUKA|nr:hypothetical protein PROFUN_14214 [Planoprotostelium fungivorum]